ncbi:ribonuclease H-like domain-containing protein [Tanacetum coccineum]
MSFDDLYNNFKIVEQEVKGTASSSSSLSSSSQNMAFVSSPSSTNEVNTAYGVSTANTQKTSRNITINGSDTAGYDKSKVECFNCHKMGHFARECRGFRNQDNRNRNQDSSRRTINVEETSSKSMVAINGNEVIFCEQLAVLKRDISYKDSELSMLKSELEKLKQEKESNQLKIENFDKASKRLFLPPNLDLSYSGLEEFQQPEFEGYGPKPSKSVSEDTSNKVKESLDAPLVEKLVSDDKLEKKTVFPTVAKI